MPFSTAHQLRRYKAAEAFASKLIKFLRKNGVGSTVSMHDQAVTDYALHWDTLHPDPDKL